MRSSTSFRTVWPHAFYRRPVDARASTTLPHLRRRASTASTVHSNLRVDALSPSCADERLSCIVDVMIVPSGMGASHSKHVAGVVQSFRENPELTVATHAMGTCLEGEWDAVMRAVKVATLHLHAAGIARVTTTLKVGTRTDKQGYTMAYKMQRIQERLDEQVEAGTASAQAVRTDKRVDSVKMSSVCTAAQDSTQQHLVQSLLTSASQGDLALIESLLEQPEALRRINATDDSPGGARMTPLHWASKNGHAAVCAALIQAGATVTSCDQFGRTAIDLAQRYGHDAVVSLLLDASGNH